MFYPFTDSRAIESRTNKHGLKGTCASWSDTPNTKQDFGQVPLESVKSQAGCKTRCIIEYPLCLAIDYGTDSTCTTHSTIPIGRLLGVQGTIHSEIKAVPCDGKPSQYHILISSIQLG